MTNLYEKRIQGLQALKDQLQKTTNLVGKLIDLEMSIQEREQGKK